MAMFVLAVAVPIVPPDSVQLTTGITYSSGWQSGCRPVVPPSNLHASNNPSPDRRYGKAASKPLSLPEDSGR